MAGHSKWANIKHQKARADAQRGNLFAKLIREIMVASRQGGSNLDSNLRLRIAVRKARDNNVPNDNIQRAIKKGAGELEGVNFEDVVYEGYGPGGAALLIEAVTDNRNRTTSEIRHLLQRNNGSLGEVGSVAWMFERKGYLALDRSKLDITEDDILLMAIEAGAQDVEIGEESFEIYTEPEDFTKVQAMLEENDLPLEVAEMTMIPVSSISFAGDEAESVLRLIDVLDGHDDVQRVHSNAEIR